MKVVCCIPVQGPPGRYIVPGSIDVPCSDCGDMVYVAPSSQQLPGDKVYVCPACTGKRLDIDPDAYFEPIPSQLQEVKTWRKRN